MENPKIKESIIVRGVAESLQAMAMPQINNLIHLFEAAGYSVKVEKSNNTKP